MKIHFLVINRIACDEKMPQNATFAVNPRLVTCKKCRKTKIFRKVSERKHKSKEKSPLAQPEMFE